MSGRKQSKSIAKRKGDIVEEIVAMMHRVRGVKVEHDVKLPTKDGTGRRQIDVLLTSQVAGYAVRFAIECKNYKRPIHRKDVENFAGLLDDVGIPTRYGILIAAGKIGGGAVHRARAYGMRVLRLAGLTQDGLASQIERASQSIVFMVPIVTKFAVTNNISSSEDNWQEMFLLYDREGKVCGFLPDLIWRQWMDGKPPSEIGEHEIQLDIPDGWHHRMNGRQEPLLSAEAKITVTASVVSFSGQATQHMLIDPTKAETEKLHTNVSFNGKRTEYPVKNFNTEGQLAQFLEERSGIIKLTVGRIRIPRIRVGHIFWPPSERSMKAMHGLWHRYEVGEVPLPSPEDLKGVDGGDLRTAWEPIYPDHPLLQNIRESGRNHEQNS